MTNFRVAILATLLASSAATAGPVPWWYTSTSTGWYTNSNARWPDKYNVPVSGVGYGINPASGTFLTELGGTQDIDLTDGVQTPALVSPIPLEGPTLWLRVEFGDIASGESHSFRVPLVFYDNEPAPEGEVDWHVPRLGNVPPYEVVLGRNKYRLTQGPDLALTVAISEAPEPATLLMGVVGLAGIGLVRRRLR